MHKVRSKVRPCNAVSPTEEHGPVGTQASDLRRLEETGVTTGAGDQKEFLMVALQTSDSSVNLLEPEANEMIVRKSEEMAGLWYVNGNSIYANSSGGYYAAGQWCGTMREAIKLAYRQHRQRLRLCWGV